MPIITELSLTDNITDPIKYDVLHSDFTAANTSYLWTVFQIQAKCDLDTLDRTSQ